MRLSIPILGLLPSSLAALITVSVPQTSVLANPSSLSSSTHAVLEEHGVKINAPLTRANTFVFENVTVGSYLLSVFCRDYFFENVRIDVTEAVAGDQQKSEKVEAWQTFRGNEWNNRGERRAGLAQGSVEVRPLGMKEYYQARSTFSVFSFLKSPMILMALVSLALIVGMPYLLENMDPESRAEFEEYQKSNPVAAATNPANAMQNFDLAGWMAGAPSSSSGTSTPQTAEKGGQSGGRRRG